MPKIHLLPDELINQIAAGEVVERPASVVKELVENSLDAGADRIEIEIKDGGRKEIRVVDNGCGMEREDARLAFSRHTTSKISGLHDLEKIKTLGFRGEALPSIASVAKVDLVSKPLDAPVGTLIKIEAGKIKIARDHPANPGTIITVSDLFYNTPARRKFLKSQLTETRHVIDLVTNFSLAFTGVAFKLTIDGRVLFNLSRSAKLSDRIPQIFNADVAGKLIEFDQDESVVKIGGFIGKPELSKSSRTDIRFFVNQRSINNRTLLHALTSAYGDALIKGRFPLAILFLEVPAEMVDVNVHPQKLEVRFQDERAIHDLVYRAVKKTLDRDFAQAVKKSVPPETVYPATTPNFSKVSERGPDYQAGFTLDTFAPGEQTDVPGHLISAARDIQATGRSDSSKIYQLFKTYLLTQTQDELLIIDQHSAHERVLYEEILNSLLSERGAGSQKLLFPETIELDPAEANFLKSAKEILEKLGFEIQPLSGRTVMISAVPSLARHASARLLKNILAEFIEKQDVGNNMGQALASLLACHAAVKAGDSLSEPEMHSLLKSLLIQETPRVCPHGRPTLIRIPLSELERRFGRV